MSERFKPISTEVEPERAILVGVALPHASFKLADTMAELGRLAETAGSVVVAQTTQQLEKPNPKYFVGTGKAQEIADLVQAHDAQVVIFDDELTPSQQSNLERIVGKDTKVIDRTALILDIFSLHAHSREGRLQVRLAQNQYLYPRLRGMWAHLASNRMGGGVGSRFGEGESQLEVDRRMVRKRITSIRKELAQLDKNRQTQRKNRQAGHQLRVALAGYTNAGKSSLLNALTDAQVLSYDKLFATLDATTRKYTLAQGREILLTDTVGFIQKLPTTLIESFKSTLDEIVEADAILHVVDASDPAFEEQMVAVDSVLEQIEAGDIPRLRVFNKIDLLEDARKTAVQQRFHDAVLISAHTGEGLDELINRLEVLCAARDTLIKLLIPFDRGDLVSLAHESCSIIEEHYTEKGTALSMRVPPQLVTQFQSFEVAD